MDKKHALVAFQGEDIRRIWHQEEWWFSVVDVVAALTQSEDPRNYWKVLKHRLKEEGSEVVTKCNQLKIGKWAGRAGRLSELLGGNWSQRPGKKLSPN